MLVLTFQVGCDHVAIDVRLVKEVVPRVPLNRPAGSPDWMAGMFMYRGNVVPVVDLYRLLDAGECPNQLSSRIIIVPITDGDREFFIGLSAAHVSQVRELQVTVRTSAATSPATHPDLGPVVVDHGDILRLLDLKRLLPDSVCAHLTGISWELSA